MLSYLLKKKAIKEFVIWGRSMGAVAALLYATNNPRLSQPNRRKEKSLSATHSLKSSMVKKIE